MAKEGKEAFYKGRIAEAIVKTVQDNGGCLTMEDMESHYSTFDDPISTDYRGYRIWEMPPNGQGIVALMGLNILEGYHLGNGNLFVSYKILKHTAFLFSDIITDPTYCC